MFLRSASYLGRAARARILNLRLSSATETADNQLPCRPLRSGAFSYCHDFWRHTRTSVGVRFTLSLNTVSQPPIIYRWADFDLAGILSVFFGVQTVVSTARRIRRRAAP